MQKIIKGPLNISTVKESQYYHGQKLCIRKDGIEFLATGKDFGKCLCRAELARRQRDSELRFAEFEAYHMNEKYDKRKNIIGVRHGDISG
jgi:hypothetical protein